MKISYRQPASLGNAAGLTNLIGPRERIEYLKVKGDGEEYHLLVTDQGEVFSWLAIGDACDWCPCAEGAP